MKLTRRIKYIALSVGVVVFLFMFSYTQGTLRVVSAALALLTATAGTAFVQYTTVTTQKTLAFFVKKTISSALILPTALVLGAILSLIYFPNLGLPTRIITIGAVGALMYATGLVNNIFLVVFEREETIPLYRVAVAWSQILTIVVAIPLFSGMFKFPINSIYQALLAAFVAGNFAMYLMRIQEMDEDVPEIEAGEEHTNASLIGFVVFSLSIATAFIPTESFLRSLLISSVLMSSLGYLQAHYKNTVTKKLMFEYTLIALVFLLFVLIFN